MLVLLLQPPKLQCLFFHLHLFCVFATSVGLYFTLALKFNKSIIYPVFSGLFLQLSLLLLNCHNLSKLPKSCCLNGVFRPVIFLHLFQQCVLISLLGLFFLLFHFKYRFEIIFYFLFNPYVFHHVGQIMTLHLILIDKLKVHTFFSILILTSKF